MQSATQHQERCAATFPVLLLRHVPLTPRAPELIVIHRSKPVLPSPVVA